MTAATAAPAATIRPGWYSQLATDKNKGVAHVFLVWGSDDYVVRGYPLERWLAAVFAGSREKPGADVVLRYSVDQGITFGAPSMELLYRKTLGLETAAPPADPMLAAAQAALRGATGAPVAAKPGDLPSDPDEAIAQIIDFLKLARTVNGEPKMPDGARNAAAIVEGLDAILPGGDKATMPASRLRLIKRLKRASTDRELQAAGNPLILLAPTLEDVHEDVRAANTGVRTIEVPLPDKARRLAFILELIQAGEVILDEGLDPEQLAAITAGLYLRHIEDIAQRAKGGKLTRAMALERQGELMAAEYADGLKRLEPTFGYDALYGVDYLVDWFRKWVIAPMKSGDPEVKAYAPMGVGEVGPPGTAKSVFAKATAYEAGVNAVELSLTKSKWQGESARNLAKQIRGIKAYTPCIVFVDEYDKFLAGGEGDGDSVNAELRKMWQEFTADTSHRGDILLLVATNYPQNILPALARKGRIDYWAPLLAPGTGVERAQILGGHLSRRGFVVAEETVKMLAANCVGWTGADLEAAVIKAGGLVKIMGMSIEDALEEAVSTLGPTDPKAVEAMTLTAMRFANDLALLPPNRREQARKVQREAIEPEREPEAGAVRTSGGLEL